MRDILPAQKEIHRHIEDVVEDVLSRYGYQEVGLPGIESTQLFARLVGEATDIVEKEMYSFEDRNGDSIALRPEGTAGCVRLALDGGLIFNQTQRLWYKGAMFRYDRPQKGRYRQFEQIGAESFGMAGPDIDAEMLLMNRRMWQALGLDGQLRLELNSIGNAACRQTYQKALVAYLNTCQAALDEDSRRRLETNPLRILDSKDQRTREVLADAPALPDFLDDESRAHFADLCAILDANGLPYVVNPRIVRGLDYYTRTVFEWLTSDLGAQGTVCGGGRYDGLVAQLGGRATPGVGFSMGLDRLALLLEQSFVTSESADVFVVSMGEAARAQSLCVAEQLRDELASRKVVVHCGAGKFKAQLKKADVSGARLAIILGEDELAAGTVGVKMLREQGEQQSLALEVLGKFCAAYFDDQSHQNAHNR